MLYSCVLYCLTAVLPVISTAARYFIVLRLAPNTTALQDTSAQFKLIQRNNSTRAWDCASSPNPIIYPSGPDYMISAKSIDLELGSRVECMQLNVSVVVEVPELAWEKECSECGECPGFLTSTTELERSDSETTQHFQITPATVFQVYSAAPTESCARRQLLYVPPPRVAFRYENSMITSCHVTSRQQEELQCNMTVTSGGSDVIATAVVAKEIQIPTFVWKLGLQTIQCSCSCRIKQNEDRSDLFKQAHLSYSPVGNNATIVTTTLPPYRSSETQDMLVLAICIVSVLLVLSTAAAIFFLHLSRQLYRRLGRSANTINMMQRNTPAFQRCDTPSFRRCHPPNVATASFGATPSFEADQVPRIHSISNECHHYNTVSLRLSDCVQIEGRGQTWAGRERPIYEKLKHHDLTGT